MIVLFFIFFFLFCFDFDPQYLVQWESGALGRSTFQIPSSFQKREKTKILMKTGNFEANSILVFSVTLKPMTVDT